MLVSRGPQNDKYILKHRIKTLYGLSKTSVMCLLNLKNKNHRFVFFLKIVFDICIICSGSLFLKVL